MVKSRTKAGNRAREASSVRVSNRPNHRKVNNNRIKISNRAAAEASRADRIVNVF